MKLCPNTHHMGPGSSATHCRRWIQNQRKQEQLAERLAALREYDLPCADLLADVSKRGERALDAEMARMDRIDRKAQMVFLAAAAATTVLGLAAGKAPGALRFAVLTSVLAAVWCAAWGLLSREGDALGDVDWLATDTWPHRDDATMLYVLALHRLLHARRDVNNVKATWVRRAQVTGLLAIALAAVTAWGYRGVTAG